MAYHGSLHANISFNKGQTCRVQPCSKSRVGLSYFCNAHELRHNRYGHPEGRALYRRKDYSAEVADADKFIKAHMDHPGIQATIQWLQQWMDDASVGRSIPGQREFRHLNDQSVSPLNILIEIIAIYLLSRSRPYTLPDDDRLTYAFANAVFKLAPFERREVYENGELKRRPKVSTRGTKRDVGRRIRSTLGLLLININEALLKEDQEKRLFRESLITPFNEREEI